MGHAHQCVLATVRINKGRAIAQRRTACRGRADLVTFYGLAGHDHITIAPPAHDIVIFKSDMRAVRIIKLQVIARTLDDHVVEQLLFALFAFKDSVVLTGFGFKRVGLARLDGQRRLIGRQNNRGILDRPGNRGFSNGTPSRNCSENSELKN